MSGILRVHVLLILIKNFYETLHKLFFAITRQNNFLLAWIDWSRVFEFRISLGKTLIAFDFDAKLTQSGKILSSPVLCSWSGAFYFRVGFARMPCKQKYCIKNMVVKIPILILLRFCLLYWLKKHLFCVLSVLQLQVLLIT